jgi:hypothetical protein
MIIMAFFFLVNCTHPHTHLLSSHTLRFHYKRSSLHSISLTLVSFTVIPGCSTVDFSKTDYCVDPADVPDGTTAADDNDDNDNDQDEEEEEEQQATVIGAAQCNRNGIPMMPFYGEDSAERMLLREGVIDEIPSQLCDAERANRTKNVIMVSPPTTTTTTTTLARPFICWKKSINKKNCCCCSTRVAHMIASRLLVLHERSGNW